MNSIPRILIVDDEPEIRMLVAQILAHERFEIREVGDAAEAIRILDVFTPHLLITDYSLPDVNGSELIRRAKHIIPDLKCLLLTGWRDFPDQLSNPALADVIMSKPFSVEALEAETRRLLLTVASERNSASSVA